MSTLEKLPRITPFLWFDANAEEAVNFYLSVFKNSRHLGEFRKADGSILTIAFELDGLKFTALNGGPLFKFTEAISFTVRCDSQWTNIGQSSWPEATRVSAAGSKTGSGFPGRSCRRVWANLLNTRRRCRPC